MEYRGKVSGGVVVMESGSALPEGALVRIELLAQDEGALGQRLLKFAGRAVDLPSDMADHHDHYLHGQPKR